MKTIAYFIDPLLDLPDSGPETSPLEALFFLLEEMSDCRHILLTSEKDLDWAESFSARPEMVHLPVRKSLFSSRHAVLLKSLERWMQENKPSLLVSFDPSVLVKGEWKTLLITRAESLVNDASGKPLKKLSNRLPLWTEADHILLPFTRQRDQVAGLLPAVLPKITVFYPAVQVPLEGISWSEQETLKIRYSGGRDYFLYTGPLDDSPELIQLLKAYSLLKKWLMTGMPLLLTGPSTEESPRLLERLKTYKYRSDVTVLPDLETELLQPLMAGAYLFNFPYVTGKPVWPLEWALSAGTPILTTEDADTKDLCKDGASFVVAGDLDAWAHQMMVLYKDEQLRSRLIEKGRARHQDLLQTNSIPAFAALIRQFLPD